MKMIILNSKAYNKKINLVFSPSKNCITIYATNLIEPSIEIYDPSNVYIFYRNKRTNLKP
jgi:hypothetical protein